MRQGHSSAVVDHWISQYRSTFGRLTVHSLTAQAALEDLLTLAQARTTGRQQRLSDDTAAVPTPLWAALIFVGFVAVSLQLGMADRGERLRIQGLQVAGVAAVVTTGLLIVNFLDHPYATQSGGIQPAAMRRSVVLMHNLAPGLRPTCTESGRPL